MDSIPSENSSDKKYHNICEVVDASYQYLESHLVTGSRWGMDYHFYKPSTGKYGAYQWLWDSGWHMIVWAHHTPENAIKDLRTMLQFQQPNGFIPEMIYWSQKRRVEKLMDRFFGYSKVEYTDITQLPMLGYSLRGIWDATKDVSLLKEFVPKLIHYLQWWNVERDPDQDGLISIIHPWESGLDASPLYDPAHGLSQPDFKQLYPKFLKLNRTYTKKAKWDQPTILQEGWFNFEDVGVCAVHADNWGVLAKLAEEFDPEMAADCRKYQKNYSQKIIDKCWSDEHQQFVSYYHQ